MSVRRGRRPSQEWTSAPEQAPPRASGAAARTPSYEYDEDDYYEYPEEYDYDPYAAYAEEWGQGDFHVDDDDSDWDDEPRPGAGRRALATKRRRAAEAEERRRRARAEAERERQRIAYHRAQGLRGLRTGAGTLRALPYRIRAHIARQVFG